MTRIATWDLTAAADAFNAGKRSETQIAFALLRKSDHRLADGTPVKMASITVAKRIAKAFLAFPGAALVIAEGDYIVRDLDAEARYAEAQAERQARFEAYCAEDGIVGGKAQVVSTREHKMDSNGRVIKAGVPFTICFQPDAMGYPTPVYTMDEANSQVESLPASRFGM